MNMMAMLLALKYQEYRHLRISHIFPVRGHSFLPADRVFGRIEQDIRRTPTILLPEDYYDILRRHGNLHCYLEDWQSYDFKSATKGHIKQSRAFKLSEAKCVEITTSGLGVKGTIIFL
ncbi:4-diphosphocytidyl-2-c-methyl-d-erythritol kinase [Plakobranchus ocellatus]|uniref:4-diphosphocytidyl-2-c-methyl-d-erythritol kinase n=1 Tax=Plakobranchus ocellatus TaxID=259542 RepID=A0AAV3YGJ3_9GAST|nr:4-diphosphocytidyl-2-c-methyl-d-erythritol kinase [Plakobranchus ocellatus]